MKMDCLDTGTIQGFLDGELAPAEAAGVSSHIAMCEACAAQLATADEEAAFVFSVLGREMDTLVPTQRLWSKINDSIEVEKLSAPFWKKALALVTASLANPAIAAAAVAVIMFGLFATVFVERRIEPVNPVVATYSPPAAQPIVKKDDVANTSPGSTPGSVMTESPRSVQKPTYIAASYKPVKRSDTEIKPELPVTTVDKATYVPGEESYVKTIATLNKTVENQKDGVLRPSERVSYERDMAVVDDAIAKMRKEVQKNPKNESAKQVLYTSYQNKIDLLNSVSQREELVASLK
jgi:hypothetical protein